MRLHISLVLLALFFSACSQKVTIDKLSPPIIESANGVKRVAVMSFENDRVMLANKIESSLAKVLLNEKPYFTLVSSSQRDAILQEQKFQYSSLASRETRIEIGELLGAEALITGELKNPSTQRHKYYENRYRCVDKKCKQKSIYSVSCTRNTYTLEASVRVVGVEKGEVIFSDNFIESTSRSACSDSSYSLPDASLINALQAQNIADKFLPYIAPTRSKVSLKLFDSPDISYTSKQKDLLKNALAYLELGELDRSDELLSQLLTSTGDSCFVAAYDLGVVKESKGELDKALYLYTLSDRLSKKPDADIVSSISRIRDQIESYKILRSNQ